MHILVLWPNTRIAKELKITPILDKLLEYKRNWIQRVNRMSRNRLPRVMKHYSPTGRRNHGRPLKRLLDMWDRNGSTSGPTPRQIYDDDDDDDFYFSFRRQQERGLPVLFLKFQASLYHFIPLNPCASKRQKVKRAIHWI